MHAWYCWPMELGQERRAEIIDRGMAFVFSGNVAKSLDPAGIPNAVAYRFFPAFAFEVGLAGDRFAGSVFGGLAADSSRSTGSPRRLQLAISVERRSHVEKCDDLRAGRFRQRRPRFDQPSELA